jgi:peptidoglycan/xylan/chitin deacetylase (PgdA/CDA1 family)
LKAINWILFALALAAVAFFAFSGFQYASFSPAEYTARASELDAQTDAVRQTIAQTQAELEARDQTVRSDLAQAGQEGAAAALRLEAAETANNEKKAQLTSLREQIAFMGNIRENTLALRNEYAAKIRQLEDLIVAGQSNVKICYWTFDDGPGVMTESILNYCAENGIYVTFFTSREANETGSGDVQEPELLRRETMGGHSVQNHTNSHQYSLIAGNLYTRGIDSFREQVRLQDEWVYTNTGFKPDIFRFPGGFAHACRGLYREDMLNALKELGYVSIDWSCDVMDNLHSNPDPGTVSARALWQVPQMDIAVVLSHDWNVNTYYGFIRAVPALQEKGYVFLPLFSQSWTIGNTEIKFS